jgi:hypothetical protein
MLLPLDRLCLAGRKVGGGVLYLFSSQSRMKLQKIVKWAYYRRLFSSMIIWYHSSFPIAAQSRLLFILHVLSL